MSRASLCGRRQPVTHVGLWWFSYDKTLWLIFVCTEHAERLDVVRPLLDRDEDELQRRREHERLKLAGKPTTWAPS